MFNIRINNISKACHNSDVTLFADDTKIHFSSKAVSKAEFRINKGLKSINQWFSNYKTHFPRSFLLNYGEALQDLPDDKILARLKDWNCEWLSRPNIGMSEMAATLKDNWDNIPRHRGTVFTPSFVDKLESFCSPIIPALRRLDNKDRYSNEAPDKDDILDVIEAIHKDEVTETMFMQAFNACGPVLMMAIHVLAFNCLLHNPEAFADQSVKNASTEALRTHPTKTAVNQYLIDTILQKRRTVQRTDDLWDRSQYSASDTPQRQSVNRGRRLDRDDDDDSTPGTSGTSSTTSRRRLTNHPGFAKPTPPREADRRSGSMQRRRAAANLPTTFDDEQEEEEQTPRAKNKRPLTGPATAKNRKPTDVRNSTSDESDEEDQPPKCPNTPEPKQKPKHRKRPAAVVSDNSDIDDDQLGITPRTPPESPFYRGHRDKPSAAQMTKPCQPSTSKKNTTGDRRKTKQPAPNPKPAESNLDTQTKNKKNKKPHNGLQDLVDEQDKLYANLNKVARKSK